MSLKSKGIIYTTCIRPAMLYGSETWATKIEDIRKMQRSEMRMLRWMAGVSSSERKSNECVRNMLAIDTTWAPLLYIQILISQHSAINYRELLTLWVPFHCHYVRSIASICA